MENSAYRNLEAEKLIGTIDTLVRRIGERFAGSGLLNVCQELLVVARDAKRRSEWINSAHVSLRLATGLAIAAVLVVALLTILEFRTPDRQLDLGEFVQICEAGINVLIIIGAILLFLITAESRIKRSRALRAIHELRSLAHVVDMHQLTKDPESLFTPGRGTASSPERTMSRFELNRYLDYCSEMLSLIGKIAALYVQCFNDPVVLSAANDVEGLTTGLARKVWQKIVILDREQE